VRRAHFLSKILSLFSSFGRVTELDFVRFGAIQWTEGWILSPRVFCRFSGGLCGPRTLGLLPKIPATDRSFGSSGEFGPFIFFSAASQSLPQCATNDTHDAYRPRPVGREICAQKYPPQVADSVAYPRRPYAKGIFKIRWVCFG
jgi:hypothetical protein